MIPIQEEPTELQSEFKILEKCVFCDHPTNMWHLKTNNPVCSLCAKEHKVEELHDWMSDNTSISDKDYQFKDKTKNGLDFKILEIITESNPPYPMIVAIKFPKGWTIVYMTKDGRVDLNKDFSHDLELI